MEPREIEGVRVARLGLRGEANFGDFEIEVDKWALYTFGHEVTADRLERGDRFLEEALELLQTNDYPRERVAALVEYVWGRPKGEPAQEVGGVMVTLACYVTSLGLWMTDCGWAGLEECWSKVDKIRKKQATKKHGSALPTGDS